MSASSKPPQETVGETAKLGTGPAFDPLASTGLTLEDFGPAPAHMLVANGTLTLAEAVARLYNAAGWSWLRASEPKATVAQAQGWIDGTSWLDYINSRPMKIDLDMLRKGDPMVFRGYDHSNGEGRGAAALRGEA